MRIDCEICGAAYSIDDALISEKGVRARCPQCGTQQVVHPDHEPGATKPNVPSLPASTAEMSDWGAPSAPDQNSPFSFSQNSQPPVPAAAEGPAVVPRHPTFPPQATFGEVSDASQNPFGDHSGASSARAIARSSGITALDSNILDTAAEDSVDADIPTETETSTEASASPERAAPSISAFGAAFGAQPPQPEAPAPEPSFSTAPVFPTTSHTDPALQAPVPSVEPEEAPSFVPPAENTQPGDTDRHEPFSIESGPSVVALDEHPDPASSFFEDEEPKELWQVQTSQTRKTDVPISQLKNMIRRGAVGKNDELGRMGEELLPLAHYPDLLTLLPNSTGETLSFERRVQGTAASGGVPPAVIAVVAAAVLGGGGYFAYSSLMPATTDAAAGAGGTSGASASAATDATAAEATDKLAQNPVEKVRSIWTAQHPKIDGNATAHIERADKVSRTDTQAGYEKANAHYKQALLLEPDNLAAIVGYVSSFSQTLDCRVNAEALDFTRELLDWSKMRFGDRPEIFTAQGLLQLGTDDIQNARLSLAKSMALGDETPRATLLRARVMLETTPTDALEISRSLFLAGGDYRAAEYLMGASHRRMGSYVKAKQTFQNILQVSPNHRNTLKELAILDLDAGNPKAAVRRLDQLLKDEDRDIDAHLLRAKIIHQVLKNRGLAEKRLRFVIDHMEKEAGPLIRNALVQYAHVLMDRKAYAPAQETLTRALSLDDRYPPSHFAAARLYRKQNEYSKAESHLQKAVISAGSAEGERALTLLNTQLGEVQAKAEKWEAATQTLSSVIADQPNSPRPYLALAATYMKQGETAKANVTMRKVLNMDPNYEKQRLTLSDYPDRDDVYRGYAATFLKSKVRPDEKSLQMSGAGIAYFHGGDAKRARKALNRSLRSDGKNLGALMYLGTMDLNAGNKNFAKKRLERALRTVGGQHKITKLYLARAEMAARQTKRANQRLVSLLEEDSTLLTARYSLGVSYTRTGQKKLGVEQLREVLRADPSFQPAKKVLFDLKE